MEELIARIFGNRELISEAIESLELAVLESREIQIVLVSIFFIVVVSVWTLYERIDIKGWKSLIPVYRWVVLVKALGMTPWFSIFMLLPGPNLAMIVAIYINLARVFRRSYFIVPGLLLIPIIFIPVIAFGEGKCDHYQPRAKYHDEPVQERHTQPSRRVRRTAVATRPKPVNAGESYKRAYIPKRPLQQQRAAQSSTIKAAAQRPVHPVTRSIEPREVESRGEVVERQKRRVKAPSKPLGKRKYIDFASKKPRKVAKPLNEVFAPKRVNPAPKNSAPVQQKPINRPTRPMPGDIRPMRNNIVVVGKLSETPKSPKQRVRPSSHRVR